MSTQRTAYHVIFYRLLKARGPSNFTFEFEQPLTVELQRADIIIVRKVGLVAVADSDGVILPGLWPRLPEDTVAEYKSPSGGFRSGDLGRLLGYTAQYYCEHVARIHDVRDLAQVLVVPSMTPTLLKELAAFHWTATPLGGGYYATDAKPFPLYIVLVDEVAKAEHDVLLDVVGHRRMDSDEADRWLLANSFTTTEEPLDKLEGYDELVAQAIARMPARVRLKGISPEERLEGIPPESVEQAIARMPARVRLKGISNEERLEGIPPEKRLEGIPPERQLLALSNEVLAQLPAAYVETLPEDVRAAIRSRLAH